jgi:hypothetical protein
VSLKDAIAQHLAAIASRWKYIVRDSEGGQLTPELTRLLVTFRVQAKCPPTRAEEEREVLVYLTLTRSGLAANKLFKDQHTYVTWLKALSEDHLHELTTAADEVEMRAFEQQALAPAPVNPLTRRSSKLRANDSGIVAFQSAMKKVTAAEAKVASLISRFVVSCYAIR